MQRKPLFLVAAAAELGRFLALAFLAGALGALRTGDGLSALYRYVAVPQLLFAASFFFLWLDRGRYDAYRPLALAGKIVSLLAFVPLLVALLGSGAGLFLHGRQGPIAAIACLAVDLFGLSVLVSAGRDAPKAGPGAAKDPTQVPRGPEDIETVED
jgi:hypothetical protein